MPKICCQQFFVQGLEFYANNFENIQKENKFSYSNTFSIILTSPIILTSSAHS